MCSWHVFIMNLSQTLHGATTQKRPVRKRPRWRHDILQIGSMDSVQHIMLAKLDGSVYPIQVSNQTTGRCIKLHMQKQLSYCPCMQHIFLDTYEVKDRDSIKPLIPQGKTLLYLSFVIHTPDASLDAKQLKAQKFNACCLPGASASEMKAKGFNAVDMVRAGRSFAELKEADFSIADMRNAGATVNQLYQSGVGLLELHAVYTKSEMLVGGYHVAALLSAGMDLDALVRFGYTAMDLRPAGFTCSDLSKHYCAKSLRQAGFSTKDILHAGYPPSDLITIGDDMYELLKICEGRKRR